MRTAAGTGGGHEALVQELRQALGNDCSSMDHPAIRAGSQEVFRVAFATARDRQASLASLLAERGALSRQIGKVKKSGKDPASLISRVAELTGAIKTLEAELEDQLQNMARLSAPEQEQSMSEVRLESDSPGYLQAAQASAASPLDIRVVEEVSDEAWNQYVLRHPRATCYHDLRWRQLIEETFGHDTHYLCALDADGEVRGVLPLVHLSSRLFGSFMVSMPYFNYGGPLSDHGSVDDALMEAAAQKALYLRCEHLEIRETFSRSIEDVKASTSSWPAKTNKVSMVLPLPTSEVQLDAQFSAKLRSQTRRASRAGAEASTGGLDLLDDFYRVFARNMRDLGTPVYPKCFFKNILGSFAKEAFLVVVYLDSRPVAGGFLISHGKTLEIPWASSLREANAASVNMLLYRHSLGEAIRRGYDHFDFGRSSKDAPTHRFKRQWGALEHPLYWHYWLADGDELPGLSPDNAKYRAIIRAWQMTPVWVTNQVGPQLIKYLP